MTQATEKKDVGVLRAFWEGFKEGWNSSSAQEDASSPAPEEVIEVADEWDIDDMQETVVAAETIEPADEWDTPETVMAVEAPQEKYGLAAFFEGFRDGWNNPPSHPYVKEDRPNNILNIEDQEGLPYLARITFDPVYGSSDAMGMNHEPGRAVYIYEYSSH